MRIKLWMMMLISLVAMGCATTKEGDRQTFHQTQQAGHFVYTNAVDPAIKQAGLDIEQNMTQTLQVFGEPKKKEPYSPKASEDARGKQKEDHPIRTATGLGILAGLLLVVTNFAKNS